MGEVIPIEKLKITKEAERIYDILSDLPALASVVLTISFIDELLERLLRQQFRKESKTTDRLLDKGILGSIKAKFDLAYCLELIWKIQLQDLDKLISIRNMFAHNYEDVNFNDTKIFKLCEELHGPKFFLMRIEDIKEREELDKNIRKSARAQFNMSAMMIIESIILSLESNNKIS
jgi:DNA-binding MltR family transcriptional regulator